MANGRLFFFLALLPIFIQIVLNYDFRAVKYAKRNGKCFVDVYQPVAQKPEPPTNFFIRQTYPIECAVTDVNEDDAENVDYVVRGFNLLPNEKGGYRFKGCFYEEKPQYVICYQLEGNVFNKGFHKSCEDAVGATTLDGNKKYFYIEPGNVEIHDHVYYCAVKKVNNDFFLTFVQDKNETRQYNAVLNRNITWKSDDLLAVFYFGNVTIKKKENSQFEIEGKKTKWSMNYDYVFDDKQAEGKVELPFSTIFYGIKYVVEGPNQCFVVISNVKDTNKNKTYEIDCSGPDVAVSFGILKDKFDDKTYFLRGCFLEYFNVIPFIKCFTLKDGEFSEDFSYSFQNCYFVAGEIDAEHCTYYEDTDVPPNIMWGSFYHESKQLKGIMIDYAGQSCELEIKNGKNVSKETQISAKELGRGFDVIRDDFLTRSNLSFILDSRKEDLNKTSPIMSTGSNIFIKGANGTFVRFDPRGNSSTIDGDYHAIIDDSFFKLL